MLSGQKLRNADIVTSTLLILFGFGVIASALAMPWQGRGWYTSPGLFPLILGGALVTFSVGVLVNAFREGGHHKLGAEALNSLKQSLKSLVAQRVALMWSLIIGYVFTLSTVFDYYIGSALFLLAFMLLMHRPAKRKRRLSDYIKVFACSVLVPLALGLAFERIFLTPLP